jgi:hypothetical protein
VPGRRARCIIDIMLIAPGRVMGGANSRSAVETCQAFLNLKRSRAALTTISGCSFFNFDAIILPSPGTGALYCSQFSARLPGEQAVYDSTAASEG